MAVYTVDSDAVFTAHTAVRGTVDHLQAETQSMMSQLVSLQSSWTGTASTAFQHVVDQWRATQHQVEESLAAINTALASAGRHYADAESATAGLFR